MCKKNVHQLANGHIFNFLNFYSLMRFACGVSSVFIQLAFQVFCVNYFHINHPFLGVDNF